MINKPIEVNVNRLLPGECEAVMIGLGKKSEYTITSYVEQMKKSEKLKKNDKKQEYIDNYNNMREEKEIIEQHYLDLKSKLKLNDIGKLATDEEIKADIKKFKNKYLGDKSLDDIIDELAEMSVDIMGKKIMIDSLVMMTLFCVLRRKDDLTIKLFKDIDELEENLDDDEIYRLWGIYGSSQQVTDEEIKN